MTLHPEIEKQISDRGDKLTEKLKTDTPFNTGYVQGFVDGHESGATEWAGKAEGLIKLLQGIVDGYEYTKPHYPWWVKEAKTALAKYKEMGNEKDI